MLYLNPNSCKFIKQIYIAIKICSQLTSPLIWLMLIAFP